jgi:hypothetical protein
MDDQRGAAAETVTVVDDRDRSEKVNRYSEVRRLERIMKKDGRVFKPCHLYVPGPSS